MPFLNWHGLMNQKKTVWTLREVSFLLHIHVLNVGKKVTGKKVTEKKSQIWVGKKVTGKKVTKMKTFFFLLYVRNGHHYFYYYYYN